MIQLCSINVEPSLKGVAVVLKEQNVIQYSKTDTEAATQHIEEEKKKRDTQEYWMKADVMNLQGSYERWMELYKTCIGGLHIWSWRVTPVLGCMMISNIALVMNAIVTAVFLYSSLFAEPDLVGSTINDFQKVSPNLIQRATTAALVLVGATLGIAMVSIRYRRLHVLVATLRVPRHRLDDFTVLQEYAACVTIFDQPINTETFVAAYRLVFAQILLVALSTVG